MKEKNFKRKQALKKAKEKKALKKKLHRDIADFMVDCHYAQLPQPWNAARIFLRTGWKGYYNERGRDLVHQFEDTMKQLRYPEKHTMVFYDKRQEYADEDDIQEAQGRKHFDMRQKFYMRGDALLSRLMELAFDLDYDD